MIDTKAIKAAAEAVRNDVFHVRHEFGAFYSLLGPGDYFMGRVRGKERADFIATANPATVIALRDEIERLTIIASELQDLCDRQAKRLAEVEKDAARYVWLRDGNDAKHGRAAKIVDNHYGLEWDDLIDLAMGDKQ